MARRGSWLSRSILVLAVALVLVAIGGSGGAMASDDLSTADLEIGDELAEQTGTTAVIVRFNEIPPAEFDGDDPEAELEAYAAKTQDPLVTYANETTGITVEASFWLSNTVLLQVDTDRVPLETFEQFDDVDELHANFDLEPPERPMEPAAVDDFDRVTPGLDLLNVPTVWDRFDTRGERTRLVVLDTGIDADHPDLELYTEDPADATRPGGWAEFDETGERVSGSTPYDSGSHGTHVSGTAAGGNASDTAIGVAPEAELAHGLVLTEEGGTFAQLLAGMEWAVETEADVINFSLGNEGRIAELIDPVDHAIESGAVVVAAIGNQGHGTSGAPGNVYEAVSVGAVDADGAVASFSGGETINRSQWDGAPADWPDQYTVPSVTAPGVAVSSAMPGGGYAEKPGTSMATPHVSGVVALMLSVEPDATADEINAALRESAWKPADQPAGQDDRYGYGIVDAESAVADLVELRAEDSVQPDSAVSADESADATPFVSVTVVGLLLAVTAFLARRQ